VGSNKKLNLNPLEVAALKSTTMDSKFGHEDDDVPVRFNPHYIGTTLEISSTERFSEETSLNRSKTV
jgi:hypothetical protein